MYTYMCMYVYVYYAHAINPIYMAYMKSVNFDGHRLMHKLYDTWSHDAWCMCVWVRCMTTLRMANKNSQFHTLSFDHVCHSGFSNLLVHGMWHLLILLSFAAQCLVSGFPSCACRHPDVYIVCSISLSNISIALSAPTVWQWIPGGCLAAYL